MKEFTYQYPGNPVDVCLEISRDEFKQMYPERKIEIYSGTFSSPIEVYEMGEDEIHCDSCNEDPGKEFYLTRRPERVYCQKCADEWIIPHKVTDA